MVATLTSALGILKEVYEGDINNQLNEEKVLMKRIESSTSGVFENAGGKYVVFPVRTSRNQGISYRAENTQLGAAGQQGYASTQEQLKYGYGRLRLTGQLMELADTNAQAFANAADAEMSGLKEDVVKDSNRIAWGAYQGTVNVTGVISRATAGSATSTVSAPTLGSIQPGMVIDIVDNTGTLVAGGGSLTVVSAAPYATSFTVSAAVTTVTGNNIVRSGDANREPNGILGLVNNTGTIHNINSATAGNEYWRSTVDSTTTTLTEAAMIAACDNIRRAGGKRPSAIFASLGVRRAYFNLMTSLRRYNEPKEFSGGLIGLAFNYEKELPVVSDVDAPDKTMVFLCESEIKEYRTKPWYFAANDGSIFKYVMDFDAWEVLLKQYWQLVTHQRNSHAVMNNITEG
jgi:hypothetical protein